MTKLAAFALLAATAAACGAPDDVLTGQNDSDLIQANAATDDKSVTTPTAAWVYTGVSAAFIAQQINALGARLTNLEVDPADSSKFTVTLVHNSGVYAVSGWWWYYGVTSSQLTSYINQNQARLIDVQKYDTPNGPRFAAVMVSNT